MTDLSVVFLLGPLYFFPQLLSFGSTSSFDFVIFIISGLGTAFWVAAVSVIGGLLQS